MSITMNLYYTGKDGNARKFAEEMERSGTADRIRRESGNENKGFGKDRLKKRACEITRSRFSQALDVLYIHQFCRIIMRLFC